jgi:hypothetical protein
VAVDSVLADDEAFGDLPVGETLGDPTQHLPFPAGEVGQGSVTAGGRGEQRPSPAPTALPRARPSRHAAE